MKWFRLYDDIIDDPKILRLPAEFRWNYVGILCISSRQSVRGSLPSVGEIAIHLRISEAKVVKLIEALIEAGLIDEDRKTKALAVHGWDNRQYKSDNATERWRKHRDSKGANVGQTFENRCANGPETETETETETESPLPPTIPPPKKPSPEESQILARAAERWGASSGDSVVSDLLREYPADWVKLACDAEWDKHQAALNVSYLRGILRGYQRDGGPPKVTMKLVGKQTNQPPVIPMNHPPMPGHMSRAEYEAQRARAK